MPVYRCEHCGIPVWGRDGRREYPTACDECNANLVNLLKPNQREVVIDPHRTPAIVEVNYTLVGEPQDQMDSTLRAWQV